MLTQIMQNAANKLLAGLKKAMGAVEAKAGGKKAPPRSPNIITYIANVKLIKKGQVVIRWDVDLGVYMEFKHVADEQRRYEGMNMIIEACVALLALSKLDLEIAPLEPVSISEVTTAKHQEERKVAYVLKLKTRFDTKSDAVNEEDAQALLTIGLEYFLQDPTDDGVADASDEITIKQD